MKRRAIFGMLVLAAMAATAGHARAQGILLRGVSAINEGIGGVATACPIDSAGALHWNPGSISGLPGSDMSFGTGLVLPDATLSSSYPAYGPGLPAQSGFTRSECGCIPAPSMAMVKQDPCSRWTLGFGLYAIGGAQTNYAADPHNPILRPQPFTSQVGGQSVPTGGYGNLTSKVELFQMSPTAAYQLTDRLSIGFSPTITLGRIIVNPLYLTGGYVDEDGGVQFSTGVGTRYGWGGGFQIGAYFAPCETWRLGFTVKSPQWTEPFRFNVVEYADGEYVSSLKELNFYLPTILSWGAAYTGWEKWILAADIRYFNYAGAMGFRSLGWRDIMSVHVGAQRHLSDKLMVRAGYVYNDSPIPDDQTFANLASPLLTMHTLTIGASYMFAENWVASIAYAHGFENSVQGPGPAGTGIDVGMKLTANVVNVGFSKRF